MQARRRYFDCVAKQETGKPVAGPAVPIQCKLERQAFEACCKDSWVSPCRVCDALAYIDSSVSLHFESQVKHFDALHFKQQKFAQLVKQ